MSGPELGLVAADQIVLDALCKSADRAFLLDVEQQILDFIDNPRIPRLSYPKQNAYRRLLLHKLADYYSLSHVVAGRSRDEIVFYRKQESLSALPLLLASVVPAECVEEEEEQDEACDEGASPVPGFTRILVKKPVKREGARPASPVAVCLSPDADRQGGRAKTIEERQAEYERTRAAIFQDECPPAISGSVSPIVYL
ncbi:hypothetical protein H4S07_003721 [Coemansia furcata]|uniref:Uncharacterized protein n=1 Tax=Coemansia furcata TaxID=417177 RepID=A0ACC1LE03_9FUNG|nr:hypothetical protein H4S07_003721 [Coemansia furcata]